MSVIVLGSLMFSVPRWAVFGWEDRSASGAWGYYREGQSKRGRLGVANVIVCDCVERRNTIVAFERVLLFFFR